MWWLLREIKAAAIICEDVSFDTVHRRRVQNAPTGAPALPLPTARALFTPWSVSKVALLPSPPSFTLQALCCWFPSESGAVCTKTAVVATIEAIAIRLHIPVVGLLGNRLLGGHSWHVPEHVVAAMGRWGGPTVRRYMAEAPTSPRVSAVLDQLAILYPTSRWKQPRLRRT